jgi:hypothetical protein
LLSVSGQHDPVTGRRIVDPSVYSVEFKPRSATRRFLALIMLAGLATTGYFAWLAYQERTTVSYGVAGTIAVFTVVIWATWATAAVSHLHVHGGVLEASRAGRTERFDLTSHYTIVRVEGSPRSNRWRVLIERPANTPYVIDRTMVDPKAFMRVLQAYHHGV